MVMVKIQVPDRHDSATALMKLSECWRIDCYPEEVYIVPEPCLEVLNESGIAFHVLERGDERYAEKTLRDSLAGEVQRRATG